MSKRYVLGKCHDGYAVFDRWEDHYVGVRMTVQDALTLLRERSEQWESDIVLAR